MMHEMRDFYDPHFRVYNVRTTMKEKFSRIWKRTEEESKVPDMWVAMQEVAQLFAWIDEDGSGEIDRGELKDAVTQLGIDVRETELDYLFEICDPDGSGEIDVNEFMSWYFSHADDWIPKRRSDPSDKLRDSTLLRRESLRFEPRMLKCYDAFWQVRAFLARVRVCVDVCVCVCLLVLLPLV